MRGMRGAALLVLMLLLFTAAAGVLIARLPASTRFHEHDATRQELMAAKEALLAFAIAYEDNYARPSRGYYPAPGYFPCPNTGIADDVRAPTPPCRGAMIGRLPNRWEMRSGSGRYEQLPAGDFARHQEFWYALSNGFQDNNGSTPTINTTTLARLSVDQRNDVVAVIFAPGAPLGRQSRPSNDVRDYLDGANADGDLVYASRASGEFNDLLVYITRDELMRRLAHRVARDIKPALDAVFDQSGSYPATFPATTPPWFAVRWQPVATLFAEGATASLCFDNFTTRYRYQRASPIPREEAGTCPG